jgi:hypothetical protein
VAALALLIVAAVNYGWGLFAPETRGIASKALDAAAILCLLCWVYSLKPSRALGLVVMYGAYEQLQTVLCSVAYAFESWQVPEGESICSARIDFDLGAIGVVFCAAILHKISQPVKPDRSQKSESNAP